MCHTNQWQCLFSGTFTIVTVKSVSAVDVSPLFTTFYPHLMCSPNEKCGQCNLLLCPWGLPLPNSSRSSQNSIGPKDRNSLPCRYQSPLLLTIILICLSLLFSLPMPWCLLPTLAKQGFTLIVPDSWTCRLICGGFRGRTPHVIIMGRLLEGSLEIE